MSRPWPAPASSILAAIVLLSGVGLFFVDPATQPWLPPCPFRWALGWYCPGCGSVRALHRLLHGNVAAALRMNSLFVLSLPLLALLAARPRLIYLPWIPWSYVFVVIGYGILRNLSAWPFRLLAPH